MYRLEIKERALQMMQEAYLWYEDQQQGLGAIFLSELDKVYEKLTMHPEYFSMLEKQYRQTKLSRFPYVVIYEIIQAQVIVFAVFHTSQNPKLKTTAEE